MTPRRAAPRAVPTRTPITGQVSGPVMRNARSWTLSEVAVAARAILAVEREAARARERAGTLLKFSGGFEALDAVAQRWGKSGRWLRQILDCHTAAAADPARFGAAIGFLDSGGAPNVAWAYIGAARDSESALTLPALKRHGRELLTTAWKGRWTPIDINLAARALVEARLGPTPIFAETFDPARRRALNDIAKLWGESADFLQRVFEVCEAAEADPDRFGFLIPVMNKAENPTAAWRRVTRLHDEQRCLNLVPVDGRFQTLVVDPPWDIDNISTASGHTYAQMSFDDIVNMPVPAWASENAHLYLWYPNNAILLLGVLLDKWGFKLQSNHTWIKETKDLTRNDPKIGLGRDFRNSTEHFIFARRGTRDALPRREKTFDTPTHHRWPVGANSEKPDEFYQLVLGSSYPDFGEAFQRKGRAAFANLYEPAAAPIPMAAE